MNDPGDPTGPTVANGDTAVDRGALPRGSCVNRYLIVDKIGQGGMGMVYKALDPELGRPSRSSCCTPAAAATPRSCAAAYFAHPAR